ncbi:Tar ligand binding domain-containing protein, partial [Achromobacter sp. AGC39]
MTQFLKDITIRRLILCTLLAVSALVIGLSAISVNGLRSAGEALATSGDLLHEVSALSRVNDQIMRARLRLSRQLEYAAEGRAAQVAEEGRSIDSALNEARKQQALFIELATKDAPAAILEPMQAGFDALVNGGIAVQRQHLEAGDIKRAREHAAGAVVNASRAFGKSIENYEAYAKDRETQLWADAAAKRRQAYIGMGAVLAVCLLLLALGDRYVVIFVRRPLDAIKAHFRRIAGGDLTTPLAPYGRNCVGQIIPYLQEMQDSLVRP